MSRSAKELNKIAKERQDSIKANKEKLEEIKSTLEPTKDDINWLIRMASSKILQDESDLFDPYSY